MIASKLHKLDSSCCLHLLALTPYKKFKRVQWKEGISSFHYTLKKQLEHVIKKIKSPRNKLIIKI